jgi:hypothetical protein
VSGLVAVTGGDESATVADGRETRELGKASHRGHRGGIGKPCRRSRATIRGGETATVADGRETREFWESIAQRPQRSQRGNW